MQVTTPPWLVPRPIDTLPRSDDLDALAKAGLAACDHIMVWDPCEGWHVLWLAQWTLARVRAAGTYTWWMPGPPALPN